MIKITKLIQTCTACPAQWSGETDTGQEIYIRYRWGCLSIEMDGQPVFFHESDDELDGFMDYAQLTTFARDLIEWPKQLSKPEQEDDNRE